MFMAPYFSAVDCTLNDNKAIYCSSELTSGRNLFSAMHREKVKSVDELKAKLGGAWYQINIVDANSKVGNHFAELVRRAQTENTIVIAPAPLMVPGWGQREYLAFWEDLIRTRVKMVRFNKNWEYSNGCTLEFATALDAKVDTLDAEGKALHANTAIVLMANAVKKIKAMDKDFDTSALELNLERARSLATLPPRMPPASEMASSRPRKSRTA
jgi:hypothetical protein